jgi:hypothetical protein
LLRDISCVVVLREAKPTEESVSAPYPCGKRHGFLGLRPPTDMTALLQI